MNLGLSLGLGTQRAGSAFNPASLFAGGEQGVFFDVNPTTAGVAAGNTVTTQNDTSGRGNNATQATSGLRPTLQTESGRFYLDFTAHSLATAAINMSARDEVTIIAGVRKGSDAAAAIVCELSANTSANDGSFYLAAPESASAADRYTTCSGGSSAVYDANSIARVGTGSAPDLAVITAQHKVAGNVGTIRRNGVAGTASTSSKGTGNFGNFPLFLGSRNNASVFYNGRLYGLIVINRTLTAGEIAQAEAWMATKTGVTL